MQYAVVNFMSKPIVAVRMDWTQRDRNNCCRQNIFVFPNWKSSL